MTVIRKYWTDILVALFIVSSAIFFFVIGEDSYIAIHDNLDLFVPQFQMMKDTHTFFAHNVSSPFLNGISRDVLPSELALGTVFYMIFPSYVAYILNFLAKVVIGFASGKLLAGEVLGAQKDKYHHLINLCAFAYGAINFFPCFGIAFTSIPLIVYLLLKLERAETKSKCVLWYLAIFAYPFVSYFSYLGIFILAYMVVAFIWISIVRRKIDFRMMLAIVILSLGYVLFEYRLFNTMLFSDVATIRETMVLSDFSFAQAMHEAWDVFVNNSFHADALTAKLVMPVCIIYFLSTNILYLLRRTWKKIFVSPFNLVMLIIIFDSIVYGLYTCKAVRNLVELLVPPLKGWQFDRTSFFNPFLWVCALFIVCKKLWDMFETTLTPKTIEKYAARTVAIMIAVIYIITILITPTRYNDLRATAVNTLKKMYGNEIDDFSYREFYNCKVFADAKADINYDGEWSVAYGLYPAQLEYNGIYTLDGYLGFYSQEYKEEFRQIIAPALDRVEASRIYYDDWGARAYLYSGSEDSIVRACKSFEPVDNDLYIDVSAFKDLGGKYIFSRFELTGEAASNLTLRGVYGNASDDAYLVYVYEAK